MPKDYYSILGVKKDATADEIKRAYRKLAHEHHPDKGGNTDRFKEINEAYQVLSDSQKRTAYDQFGTADFGGNGFNYEDLFRQGGRSGGFSGFGGFGDVFESFFGQAFSQVQVEIHVRLSQALLGDTVHFENAQGETIELKLPPATQDGQAFRFVGKGMPYRGGRGDLIAVVRINYPHRLTKEQRKLIEELRSAGL